MSDTPRTDAESRPGNLHNQVSEYVLASLARTLERELNHLKSNVSPIDWRRAYELLQEQLPLSERALIKERDTLAAENAKLRELNGSIIEHNQKLIGENEKLRAASQHLVDVLKGMGLV